MKNIIVLLFLAFTINIYGQESFIESFKKSTIKISKVSYDLYKGTIPVKLDRSDYSSGYISLPVNIIKSSSESPLEPIYWMRGGPGEANLEFYTMKALLSNHDFVLVGYRGVDGPVMPKSRKIKKALRGLDNQLFSDKSLDNLGTTIDQYFTRIAKKGFDINHYTILDVVDDFEDTRTFLGHQKINLCSQSYGTRVALLYSYKYPEAIKRSIMIGVNPPGHCVWNPETTQQVIEQYDSIYKAQEGISDITIEESIRQSFKQIPKRWSFFKLDPDKIKVGTFYLLYSKNSAVMAFDAYRRAALKGDYSGLYLIQLACDYVDLFHAMNYGDLFSKALSADYDSTINYRQLFRPGSLEIGAPLSMLYWGSSQNLHIKLIDPDYRKIKLCKTETLMVGGNLDNTNPPDITIQELLPYMPNGEQVILTNMSHVGDMIYLQYDAFKHMARRYYDEGVLDTSKFKNDPVDFKPKMSFNKMAKWLYPMVFILSILK